MIKKEIIAKLQKEMVEIKKATKLCSKIKDEHSKDDEVGRGILNARYFTIEVILKDIKNLTI